MEKDYNYLVLIDVREFQEKILSYITSSEKLDELIKSSIFDGDPKYKQAIIHGMSLASMLTASCDPKLIKVPAEQPNQESTESSTKRNEIIEARYTHEIDERGYSKLIYTLSDGSENIIHFHKSNPMPKIVHILGLTKNELEKVCSGIWFMAVDECIKIKQNTSEYEPTIIDDVIVN